MLPTIVITSGEPAGIGPDICLAAAMQPVDARVAYLADPALVDARAELLNLDVQICEVDEFNIREHRKGIMQILPIQASQPSSPGTLDSDNGQYVVMMIDKAIELCKTGQSDAMVTAPVHKNLINMAGIPFTGHTEWIAEKTKAEHPVMMLAKQELRICLATTHIPLRKVPSSITQEKLYRTVETIHTDLHRLFGMRSPRIAVCGLNPHAGESGLLGNEEREILEPAIASLKKEGFRVAGPIPGDTAFTSRNLNNCDVVLAMYHDQGLPVIKHSGFGNIVNITLGLPIIRTSVDHGTALDLAGTGKADHSSLCAALDLAIDLSNHRARQP